MNRPTQETEAWASAVVGVADKIAEEAARRWQQHWSGSPDRINRNTTYPVSGVVHDLSRMGPKERYLLRARWTGEKRPIKKGEFFLSGAVIEAYQAYNDLDQPHYVAVLV
jgi:hypothetical protein